MFFVESVQQSSGDGEEILTLSQLMEYTEQLCRTFQCLFLVELHFSRMLATLNSLSMFAFFPEPEQSLHFTGSLDSSATERSKPATASAAASKPVSATESPKPVTENEFMLSQQGMENFFAADDFFA